MNMSKIFGQDFQIGKFESNEIKGSFTGLAIRTENNGYVSYNNGELTDVTEMTFDNNGMTYVFPVNEVEVGDLILKNSKPVYVEELLNDNRIKIINPCTSVVEEYLPQKSMFGTRMYIKIHSMFDMMMPGSDKSDQGGIMQMMMMQSMMGNKKDGSSHKMMEMMMMQSMMGGQNPMGGDASNPMASMLPLMMMGGNNEGGSGNMMEIFMMMNMFPKPATKKPATKKPAKKKTVVVND